MHMCEEEEIEMEEEKDDDEEETATGKMDNSNQAPLTNALI